MYPELVAGGFLLGEYVYHRLFDSPPPPPPPAQSLEVPRTDAGAPYPIYYGDCRVRAPIVAWAGNPSFTGNGTTVPYVYFLDEFLVIGIPVEDGTNRILKLWAGDVPYNAPGAPGLTGEGGSLLLYAVCDNSVAVGNANYSGGKIEFLNGKSTQQLVDSITFVETTNAGLRMKQSGIGGSGIPGYRGFACVLLWASDIVPPSPGTSWRMGQSTQAIALNIHASTYPGSFFGPSDRVGLDMNPIDVIYDLLTSSRYKLGLDPSRIHGASFNQAAHTLATEGHGFSRSWEDGQTAGDYIMEVLRQIDATLYEDPRDGLIKIKLIRSDYDTASLPVINPTTCVELTNFSASGWTNVPTKVRVNYQQRADDFRAGSGVSQTLAGAAGQDGEVRETVLEMPGVTTLALANTLAARELAARSKPLIKCRAIVDRTFRDLAPGDAVKVIWPEASLSSTVFRVGRVNRGALDQNKVALDLIQDYFYAWRDLPPGGAGISVLPGGLAM